MATATNMVGKMSAANGAFQSLAKCHSRFFIMDLICRIGEGFNIVPVEIKSTSSSDTGISAQNQDLHLLRVLFELIKVSLTYILLNCLK